MDIKKYKVQAVIMTALKEKFYVEEDDSLIGKMKLRDDLGLDSLDNVELCMEIEKELNISISDDLADNWGDITVNEIVEQIKHLVNE